jgi:hypothetical protein
MREVSKNQPEMLLITHQFDIDFFIEAYLCSLGKPTIEKLNKQIEKISSRDPKYVFKFYSLALEHALSKECYVLPKLFLSFQNDFKQLNNDYGRLTNEDQKAIFSKLCGKKEQDLTFDAKNVLTAIETYSYQWPRAIQQSAQYSSMLSVIYPRITQSLCLARQLKLIDIPKDYPFTLQSKYRVIFYAGLLLNEETEDAFDFFKQVEVSNFKKEYQILPEEDKKKIELALINEKPIKLGSPILEEFMVDLRYYSGKLEGSKQSGLLAQIFQTVI